MSRKNKDIPGNAVASAAEYARQQARNGEKLLVVDKLLADWDEDEVFIDGFSLRPPSMDRGDWLMVIRANGPEGRLVAFHDAPTFAELIVGFVNRLQNRSLKFREDQYAR